MQNNLMVTAQLSHSFALGCETERQLMPFKVPYRYQRLPKDLNFCVRIVPILS